MESSTLAADPPASAPLKGLRIALIGRLAGMSKRDAQQLIRDRGGTPLERPEGEIDLVVVGGDNSSSVLRNTDVAADPALQAAAEQGQLEIITETQLWHRLGLVDVDQNIQRLYTPSMLAELLRVPVSLVRRWHRRGLLISKREVRRLAYFDFREVAVGRVLAELLAAGVSPRAMERKLAEFARHLPHVERPLADLPVVVEGKQLLVRQGEGLAEPGGQLRFDFTAVDDSTSSASGAIDTKDHILQLAEQIRAAAPTATPDEMLALAMDLENEGHLEEAVEMYRAALAAGGPNAEVCFLLAELLYRLSDYTAARERYYVAIELDEDYVEARANLGCVLAQTGQPELAVAAFQGALAYHPEYSDVHYHLARTLDELHRAAEAEQHWQAFLELAPESPWAAEARLRLALNP